LFKSHAVAVAIGLFLGIVMVWWVRPDSNAGAVVLIVATTLFCVVIAFVLYFASRGVESLRRKGTKP
jgi:phosphotransferase system  glucose/maltose/N-acetylglucosamine-specific IIC component